jgi:hypothetical protein
LGSSSVFAVCIFTLWGLTIKAEKDMLEDDLYKIAQNIAQGLHDKEITQNIKK